MTTPAELQAQIVEKIREAQPDMSDADMAGLFVSSVEDLSAMLSAYVDARSPASVTAWTRVLRFLQEIGPELPIIGNGLAIANAIKGLLK